MNIDKEYALYLFLILAAFVTSVIQWRQDREDKLFSILLLITFISELIADLLIKKLNNNLIVFHFYSPLQFFFISAYYNYTIPGFRKSNLGIYIGFAGITISIINSLYIQTVKKFNNFYLVFIGLTIIGMILQFFFRAIQEDKPDFFKNKHFWISVILLFFWSLTYAYWALSEAITINAPSYTSIISKSLWIVNIITYGGLSIVFILKKKQILHNGH